jgi:NTP pyrophosphatase (non-canonical NTP hydrolase)
MQKLSPQRLNALANEVGEWSKQFKVHMPGVGFLEEIGETAHCILKHAQGIRGFEDRDFYLEKLADGLGDAVIYLCHFCYINKIPFAHGTIAFEGNRVFHTQAQALHVLSQCASDFIDPEPDRSNQINSTADALECLAEIAMINDLDFDDLIISTWKQVSKRDWIENPVDADKVVEKAAAK